MDQLKQNQDQVLRKVKKSPNRIQINNRKTTIHSPTLRQTQEAGITLSTSFKDNYAPELINIVEEIIDHINSKYRSHGMDWRELRKDYEFHFTCIKAELDHGYSKDEIKAKVDLALQIKTGGNGEDLFSPKHMFNFNHQNRNSFDVSGER